MDEMYRMLGTEHQADLEREAEKHRLAAQVSRPGPRGRSSKRSRSALPAAVARLIALVARATPAGRSEAEA